MAFGHNTVNNIHRVLEMMEMISLILAGRMWIFKLGKVAKIRAN